MSNSPESDVSLKLGDIIRIYAPENTNLNNKEFLITYIDNTLMSLINPDDQVDINIFINSDKTLKDSTIKEISVLSRASTPSYAKQNNLVPSQWIDVYFDGDVPFSITGEIVDLEEDMITIRTLPENDLLYIDLQHY